MIMIITLSGSMMCPFFKFFRKDYPSPAEPGYALSFLNSVDPDHLASEDANWSESALFVFQFVNFYQKPWSSNSFSMIWVKIKKWINVSL